MHAEFNQIKFSDADVVNAEEFIPAGAYNPNNIRPFLLHDHGFLICIIFASSLQDALDAAVDAGKLDSFLVDENDLADYGPDEEGIARLGNASEPFDFQALDVVELPNPAFSFVALFNAMKDRSSR
jgi:hypothetical protein